MVFKKIRSQGIKFVLCGAVNTAATYLAYLLLTFLFSYQIAYLISYVIGIFLSYLLNSLFVFRVPLTWRKFFQFPLVYVVQYTLSAIGLWFFVELVGLSEKTAPLVIIFITLPLTFFLSRFILLSKKITECFSFGKER